MLRSIFPLAKPKPGLPLKRETRPVPAVRPMEETGRELARASVDEADYFRALNDDALELQGLMLLKWPNQTDRINLLHTVLNLEQALRSVNRTNTSKQRS